MYILPILVKSRSSSNSQNELRQFWLFLERNGNHLIQLESSEDPVSDAKEFLSTNGMQALGEPNVVGNIVFVTIDPNSKDLSSFYTWREVAPGTVPSKEVWRPFLWLSYSDNVDPLGVNRLLDTISLAEDGHTAFSVVSSYLKTSY